MLHIQEVLVAPLHRRRTSTLALGALFLALWVVAATLLWRTTVPGDLKLPKLSESSYFGASAIDRIDGYQRVVLIIMLGSIAAQITALCAMALRAPRLARGFGLGPIGSGIILGLLTVLAAWAAGIPFTILDTWWARRHGLTDLGYAEAVLAPYAELFGLTVTALVTIAIVMWLARKLGRLWWLAGAPAFAAIAAVFAFVFPYLVTAASEPLRDPELRAAADRFEQSTGAGPTNIVVEEVSSYTSVPNAYAAGFGPSKRVVLWDTLFQPPITTEEVKVVVAHELGHVARGHVARGLAWFALLAFPLLFVIAEATRRRGGMGLAENVPLAALVLTLAGLCLAPASNAISRHFEQEADWIALQATRDPDSMQTLFGKVATLSLSDPTPPSWSQALFGTHPSDLERIAMAQAWRERNGRRAAP
jgi:STE24 endopeptidase